MTTPAGMTQSSVRSSNLALILGHILRQDGRLSRADIAAQLGMTRSTVSRLVDDLIAGQVIAELDAVAGARGRPAVPLTVRRGSTQGIGLEINVERLVATVVDLSGEPLSVARRDLDVTALSPGRTMAQLAELAADALSAAPSGGRLAGTQLAFPGLVDRGGRTILRAPNLESWEGCAPAELWHADARTAALELRVANDIDCSAITLLREQPGSSFLYVTGEVGIGAAISLDGHLLTGRHGWASELGHVCVDPRGERCGCGAVGCLETVAGSRAMLRLAGQPDVDRLRDALARGDAQARAVAEGVAEALGIALGGALNLLDVTTINLGGHLGLLEPWLRGPLRRALNERVLWAGYSEIEIAVVDEAPLRAARGAGLAALGTVTQDPAAWVDPLLP
ncbi:MAG TPA: ROK family transcriptional regulator [Arachnia sp.]|nr:ROK family transcriptional regulator [Arachnia sp.]HMT85819.1 ROK family transcriptional regulator [Arachnia sp.]